MADQLPAREEPDTMQKLFSLKRTLTIALPVGILIVVVLMWLFSSQSESAPMEEPAPNTLAEIDAADPPPTPSNADLLLNAQNDSVDESGADADLVADAIPGLIPEENEQADSLGLDVKQILPTPPPVDFATTSRHDERLSQLLDALHASPSVTVSASVGLPGDESDPTRASRSDALDANEYLLTPGTVIPAVLLQGITTELPGLAVAHVSQDVFDSRTGAILLLPRGSRLSGTYAGSFDEASERLVISWDRIDRPDGSTVMLEDVLVADQSGNAGLRDQVDRRTGRVLGLTGVTSLITAGLRYAAESADPRQFRVESLPESISGLQRSTVTDEPSFGANASQELADQYGRIVQQIAERHLNQGPVLTIRPGIEFVIQITREITVPAYQSS